MPQGRAQERNACPQGVAQTAIQDLENNQEAIKAELKGHSRRQRGAVTESRSTQKI